MMCFASARTPVPTSLPFSWHRHSTNFMYLVKLIKDAAAHRHKKGCKKLHGMIDARRIDVKKLKRRCDIEQTP